MVPGRALAGLFSKSSEEVLWGSIRRLTEYIRRIDSTVIRLPYTFGDSSKLNNVRKLWEGIMDVREVRDVFTGKPIVTKQYDVDHFIPWSFVLNDELWNLMLMDSSLNSP